MNQQLLRLKSIDNIELPGILYTPLTKTDKVVIHVHGLSGNFYENHFIDELAKTYTQKNCAFFTFNNRGKNYISEFLKEDKYIIKGSCYELFEECLMDIDGVINYFEKEGYHEIYLEGHSYGCNKVCYYLSERKNESIKKIILLAPCDIPSLAKVFCGLEYERILADAYQKQKEKKENELIDFPVFANNKISVKTFLTDFLENGTNDIFRYRDQKISKVLNKLLVPVEIIYGTIDECVLTTDEEKIDKYLKENIKECNIYKIKEADHIFTGKIKELSNIILKIK